MNKRNIGLFLIGFGITGVVFDWVWSFPVWAMLLNIICLIGGLVLTRKPKI